MNHEIYIRRTLELAIRGAGQVSPNPRVGAIILKNDQIISEGYHMAFGKAHAEIVAIQKVVS